MSFGRPMISVVVLTILVLFLIALMLVACDGGTASTVVNSL